MKQEHKTVIFLKRRRTTATSAHVANDRVSSELASRPLTTRRRLPAQHRNVTLAELSSPFSRGNETSCRVFVWMTVCELAWSACCLASPCRFPTVYLCVCMFVFCVVRTDSRSLTPKKTNDLCWVKVLVLLTHTNTLSYTHIHRKEGKEAEIVENTHKS